MTRVTANTPQATRVAPLYQRPPGLALDIDDMRQAAPLVCPKCGRQVRTLQCGHCGSKLAPWQADLYSATIKQLAKTGGGRADTGCQGGNLAEAGSAERKPQGDDDLQDTQTPPSLCLWIYKRLSAAHIHPAKILDPCRGSGNLTKPFVHARVIWFEIKEGRDFLKCRKRIVCDLAMCNSPWGDGEQWLMHIVEVVGTKTPIIYVCPLGCFRYKSAPYRRYLESSDAPRLDHITLLPSDTFVGVYCEACILWFNLPTVTNVAFVPSRYLIRKNTLDAEKVAIL